MSIFLKRLELTGFKSFAQKTVFEFPSGIVAIVGPNGSGKSNIADAFRWLIGERDARQLRGEKIENLIFGGTPKKASVSVARASICFDNTARLLPVEFNEVVFSRMIDRAGLSECSLNQSPVRLKDIIEMMTKSGLGARGLTVINQGESDIFVKSSPLERREMIEEIIGLKEFRLKKDQTENQLENTKINLEKIKAMLEEIKPHLRLLKRQTDKWEKRSEAENELKNLEDKYFSFKLAEIEAGLAALEPPLDGLNKIINQKQKELSDFQKDFSQFNQSREESSALLAKRSELQRELGHLEAKLEMAGKQTNQINYQAADLLKLINEIKESAAASLNSDTTEDIKTGLQKLITKIDNFFSSRERSLEKEEEISKLKENKKDIIQKIEKLNADFSQLNQNENNLLKNFKTAEEKRKEIDRLENEKNKLIFEKEKLNLKLQDVETQLRQIGRRKDEFKIKEAHFSAEELFEIERRIFKWRTMLAGIGEIDPLIIKEAEETTQRYQFLSQQLLDLEKASADLRNLIKDLNLKIHSDFQEAMRLVNKEFDNYFQLMFGGGKAKLRIKNYELKIKNGGEKNENNENGGEEIKEENAQEAEAGIEIDVNLPRKRISSLEMLSGGERSLVSLAALFALISVNPPPFLVLDEVDSPLDERNARRFTDLLKKFSQKTQFVIITHNRVTMEAADVLYGITMEEGISKVLSLKLS